jgi:hypothetical protein
MLHKKELKILWIAAAIPFIFCVLLLFPAVRQFLVIAAERVIFHRDLRDDKWLKVLWDLGITGIIGIVGIVGIAGIVYADQKWNLLFVFQKWLSSPAKSFLQEPVSPKAFFGFIKQNQLLVISLILLTLFTYGIALFEYSYIGDTVIEVYYGAQMDNWSRGLGRFVSIFLKNIWDIKEFNIYTAVFGTLVLIVFSALSWSYMLSAFSQKNISQKRLFVFALPFSVALPWSEQLFFSLQSREVMFGVFIMPFIIYLLFTGFLDHKPFIAAAGTLLLSFIPAIYQSLLVLFCAGVFACFVLLQENTNFDKKTYSKLVLQLALSVAAAAVFYFILWKFILFILQIHAPSYNDSYIQWGKAPFKSTILSLLKDCVHLFTNIDRVYGSLLLLPFSLLFIARIVGNAVKNKIPQGRKLFYCLAGIGIPVSFLFLPVVLGRGGGGRRILEGDARFSVYNGV